MKNCTFGLFLTLLIMSLYQTASVRGDESTSNRVRVALALAEAAKSGGVASGPDVPEVDPLAGHKPTVVMWVGGISPSDHPEIAKGLADTNPVSVASVNGSPDPRIVIVRKDGSAVSFSAGSLKPSLLPAIRAELPKRIVWDF